MAPATAIAPDLRGYGAGSSEPVAGLSVDDQVDALEEAIRSVAGPAPTAIHLVGHSVGGVIAARFADRHPDAVASFISLEGNFTLKDAFWSGQLAAMSLADATVLIDRDRADPPGWLSAAGVEATPARVAAAGDALGFQPPATIHAMARAVVELTGREEYDAMLRRVFARCPSHLVAGARSRAGWDVPCWAVDAAATSSTIADSGHMMMLEQPDRLAAVLAELVHGGFRQPALGDTVPTCGA
jgi:lipase